MERLFSRLFASSGPYDPQRFAAPRVAREPPPVAPVLLPPVHGASDVPPAPTATTEPHGLGCWILPDGVSRGESDGGQLRHGHDAWAARPALAVAPACARGASAVGPLSEDVGREMVCVGKMLNSYLGEVSDVYEDAIPPPDREGDDPRALRSRAVLLDHTQGGDQRRLLPKREVQEPMPARDAGVIGEAESLALERRLVVERSEYMLRESLRNLNGIHPTEMLRERKTANTMGSEGVQRTRIVPPLVETKSVDRDGALFPSVPNSGGGGLVASRAPQGAWYPKEMDLGAHPVLAAGEGSVATGAHYGSASTLRAPRVDSGRVAHASSLVPAPAARGAAIAASDARGAPSGDLAGRADCGVRAAQPYGSAVRVARREELAGTLGLADCGVLAARADGATSRVSRREDVARGDAGLADSGVRAAPVASAVSVARREEVASLLGRPEYDDRGAAATRGLAEQRLSTCDAREPRAAGILVDDAAPSRGSMARLSSRDAVDARRLVAWEAASEAAPPRAAAVRLRRDGGDVDRLQGASPGFVAASLEGLAPRRCSDNRGHAAERRAYGGEDRALRRGEEREARPRVVEESVRPPIREASGPVERVAGASDRLRKRTPHPRDGYAEFSSLPRAEPGFVERRRSEA